MENQGEVSRDLYEAWERNVLIEGDTLTLLQDDKINKWKIVRPYVTSMAFYLIIDLFIVIIYATKQHSIPVFVLFSPIYVFLSLFVVGIYAHTLWIIRNVPHDRVVFKKLGKGLLINEKASIDDVIKLTIVPEYSPISSETTYHLVLVSASSSLYHLYYRNADEARFYATSICSYISIELIEIQ